MELSDGLRVILKGHLDWGKCRLDCFVGMLLALVRLKRMNLTQLALAFASQAAPKSRYRRWQWLSDQDIPYLIRMKENQLLTARSGRERPVRSLFADLEVGKSRALRKKRRIGQQWVWLSGMKLDSGELLILAGNQRFPQPVEVYGLRWEIENLFQCLKGRAFIWKRCA